MRVSSSTNEALIDRSMMRTRSHRRRRGPASYITCTIIGPLFVIKYPQESSVLPRARAVRLHHAGMFRLHTWPCC
jgi:hypothetical protein